MPRCAETLRPRLVALLAGLAAGLCVPGVAAAQTDAFIGQIMVLGGTYCPNGWFSARGQLVSTSVYYTLWSALGSPQNVPGNSSVFRLPNIRVMDASGTELTVCISVEGYYPSFNQ